MTITPEVVVAAYVKAREDIKDLEAQIDAIKEKQKAKEEWLLNSLQTQGLQNMKTLAGTCYVMNKESVTVGDWDAVVDFIMEPLKEMLEKSLSVADVDMGIIKRALRLEYLTKGVNKTAVLEYMGEKRENPPIPGANFVAIKSVGIRKN